MSEWKEYKLGDIAEITSAKRIFYSEYVPTGVPFYRSKEIIDRYNKREVATELYISEQRFADIKDKYGVPQKDDILLTSVGTLGIPYLVNEKDRFYFKDGNLTWFRQIDKKKIDVQYLFIWLQSKVGKQKLDEITIGSTQPALTIAGLKGIGLSLPPLPEQAAIAEVLSSLNDKIDLLHRQNKTLEQLAETLFRQWLVEEADGTLETVKLGDIAHIQNGYAFSSKDYVEYQEGHLEVLKMGHIEPGGGLRANPKKDYVPPNEKLKRWILNKNDIVMAMTDMKDNVVILGVPAMIDKSDHYVLNQRVARIYLKSKDRLINDYLLYIQLKDADFIATLQSKANSGVQVNLSTDSIKDCDIIIPPVQLQNEKADSIADFYLKKENNDIQIRILTELRDTLLPKLLNGEIKVQS